MYTGVANLCNEFIEYFKARAFMYFSDAVRTMKVAKSSSPGLLGQMIVKIIDKGDEDHKKKKVERRTTCKSHWNGLLVLWRR